FRSRVKRGSGRNHVLPGQVLGWPAGTKGAYLGVILDKQRCLLHRLAWFYVYGRWPAALIDHLNWDKRDNRIANLREGNNSQNKTAMSMRRDNTSGIVGVYWHKHIQKWFALITVGGKRIHLGYFDKIAAAAAERRAAARKLHGEFRNRKEAP